MMINKNHLFEMDWQNYKNSIFLDKKVEKNKKIIKKTNIQKQNKKTEIRLNFKVIQLIKENAPRLLNDTTSVDKNFIYKIQKDKITIDIIIDLHGYNQDEAYKLFLEKFAFAQNHKYKLMLVITGKGKVLRESLISWLKEPIIAKGVFYFCEATKNKGGTGAFYLALRNK
jgi:DNA-nicking Smr family endonuclease